MENVVYPGFETLVVQLLLYLPSKVLLVVAAVRLFDLPSRAGYCVVASLSFLLHFVFAIVVGRPYLVSLASLLVAVALPILVFSRDGRVRKMFTLTVVLLAILLSHIVPSLVWDNVSSGSPYDFEGVMAHLGYSVLVRIAQLLVLALLLAGIASAERRISRNRTDQGAFSFVWFLLMQFILASFVLLLVEFMGPPQDRVAIAVAAIVLLFVCVDVLYFFALDWYNRIIAEARRAEALQRELDEYLKSYEEIEREITAVAHMRHDMRSQLNVILMFVDQGDVERARSCLDLLIERILDSDPNSASCGRPCGDGCAFEGGVRHEAIALSDYGCGEEVSAGFAASGIEPSHPARFDASSAASAGFSESASKHAKERLGGGLMRKADHSAALHRFLEILFPASQILPLVLLLAGSYGDPRYGTVVFTCVIVGVLCVAADVILFKAFATMRKRELVAARIRLLDEQKALRRQHYERLRAELDEVEDIRSAMVAQLYDLDARLAASETDAALDQLHDAAGFFGALDERYCENGAANALISVKARACKELGIDFDCNAVLPEGLPVSDVDLCVAFSNLLDNAANSCRKVEAGRRSIVLKACVAPGILVVDVTNSCPAEACAQGGSASRVGRAAAAASRFALEGGSGSRRGGEPLLREHGWGLLILKDLAERYDGSFETSCADGVFRATVVLSLEEAPV